MATTSTLAPSGAGLPERPRSGEDGRLVAATRPTALTRFWRTFLPWQLVRFVIINLKMLHIIRVSHRSQRSHPSATTALPPPAPPPP